MKTDYKEIALQMNRLYCIGEGHLASDLLLDAIKRDDSNASDYTDYLLDELSRMQKQLTALMNEILKWTKKTEVQS
jgi:hypothetical protein